MPPPATATAPLGQEGQRGEPQDDMCVFGRHHKMTSYSSFSSIRPVPEMPLTCSAACESGLALSGLLTTLHNPCSPMALTVAKVVSHLLLCSAAAPDLHLATGVGSVVPARAGCSEHTLMPIGMPAKKCRGYDCCLQLRQVIVAIIPLLFFPCPRTHLPSPPVGARGRELHPQPAPPAGCKNAGPGAAALSSMLMPPI